MIALERVGELATQALDLLSPSRQRCTWLQQRFAPELLHDVGVPRERIPPTTPCEQLLERQPESLPAGVAALRGVADRVRFEVAAASAYPGGGYDLVTHFDCLHDMGDPVGAARRVLASLDRDGIRMIVEPFAGDRLEENLNPLGRAYYAFSTLICTPASLSQEVGAALGAQAGEARLATVAGEGGFTRFRRAAETPFNFVLEARP